MVSYGGTCGLTLDGVECWGLPSSFYPGSPSGKGVEIAVGGQHTLVVRSDGSLEGFGNDQNGCLGGGPGIIDLGGLKAVAVAAGYHHTVVLMQDGSVRAFGYNAYGELGLGDTANRGDDADEMGVNLPPVALGENLVAVAVAAGQSHTCVIVNTGALKCAGHSTAFGFSGSSNNLLVDVDLSGISAVAVSLGSSHTVVLLADGSVRAFGYCDHGRCGSGSTSSATSDSSAVDLGGGRAKAVAAGGSHTVVLMQDGSVRAFGNNDNGQLGLGDSNDRGDNSGEMGASLPPVDLGGLRAEAISAGSKHTCASLEDRTVRCWGKNDDGGLGSTSFSSRGSQPGQMGSSIPPVPLSSPLLKCGV
ncbi:regulator of chromosome condensation 1/beta-lactamase-inhibitor protein II [Baffinella frigidus]|nr:regulator of chromosome condensation 1/beta-lactamase-inhibitor protein II [Cryptophyta sp. CCMP2293]